MVSSIAMYQCSFENTLIQVDNTERTRRGAPLFLRMPYEYQEKVIMTPTRYEAGEALPVDCCL